MKPPVLITIHFSHYCEKARWALEHVGASFVESAHAPVLHIPAVKRAGGQRSTPTLVSEQGVLNDSTDILAWADRRAPEGKGLYGQSEDEKRQIQELEDFFDDKLGPDTRRFVYFYLLPERKALSELVRNGTPGWEHRIFTLGYPVIRRLMQNAMKIDAKGAERSAARVDAAFERVGGLTADGRRFLVGDRLSAADITFASLAAPVILPKEYGTKLPLLEDVPREAAARFRVWQAHPAGQFAQRLYREHRRAVHA